MAELEATGTQRNLTGIQEPRYGINIAGTQVSDRLTQEAFQNQELINQELDSKINKLSADVADLKTQLINIAEAVQKLLDS